MITREQLIEERNRHEAAIGVINDLLAKFSHAPGGARPALLPVPAPEDQDKPRKTRKARRVDSPQSGPVGSE